jgi:hypothetical protein
MADLRTESDKQTSANNQHAASPTPAGNRQDATPDAPAPDTHGPDIEEHERALLRASDRLRLTSEALDATAQAMAVARARVTEARVAMATATNYVPRAAAGNAYHSLNTLRYLEQQFETIDEEFGAYFRREHDQVRELQDAAQRFIDDRDI